MQDTQENVGLGDTPEDIEEKINEDDQEVTEQLDNKEEEQQKEEEQKKNSGPLEGSRRFNEIYGRMKSAERQLVETSERMIQLEQRLKTHESSVETKEVNEKKSYFKALMKQAADENDLSAYQQASDAYQEFLETATTSSKKNDGGDAALFNPEQGQRDLTIFKSHHSWFDKDQDKTAYAYQVQDQLRREPNSKNLSNLEFLLEIGRRVETKYKASENGFRKSPMSDGISTSSSNGKQEGQLTEDQKRIAMRTLTHLPKEERLKAYAEALKN